MGGLHDELIRQCRYYKGESENPFEGSTKAMLWYYEQCWVSFEESLDDSSKAEVLKESIDGYIRLGLQDFSKDDGTPIGIKAILLNRYLHWGGMLIEDEVEAFKRWYVREYLNKK